MVSDLGQIDTTGYRTILRLLYCFELGSEASTAAPRAFYRHICVHKITPNHVL